MKSKKTYILIVSVFVLLIALSSNAFAKNYKIKRPSPFKTLKIGSKNLTKYANKECWMAHVNDTSADGIIEIYLSDFKGTVKNNSRIVAKMKKGYKVEIRYYDGEKERRIKSNAKLPRWNNNCRISLVVKKGKYRVPYGIENAYEDEYEDEDY